MRWHYWSFDFFGIECKIYQCKSIIHAHSPLVNVFSDRPYNLDSCRLSESMDIIFLNYVAALLMTNLQKMELINESIMQLKLDNHKMHDYFVAEVR